MKKIVLVVAVLILGIFAPSGAKAEELSMSTPITSPYISDFDISYHLGRDEAGRSTLDVVERITAEFPINQNKGIVREIPRNYDGHSVSLKVASVTRNGQTEPLYSQRDSGEFHIIETGTDDYINGRQVFEFKYSMRDVTKYFASNDRDEFYWDTNGTGWRSRIDNLSVTLTIDQDLQSALTGESACYQGRYESEGLCDILQDENEFTTYASGLTAGENVTIAIGFNKGTFAEYEKTLLERVTQAWALSLVVTSLIGGLALVWLQIKARRKKYRDSELGTIIPEYIPPKDASIALSAAVSPNLHATMAAQLTDFAVRRYIQIIETKPKKWYSNARYDIKVVKDISTLRDEEREVLSDMFGHAPVVDERLDLRKLENNTAVYNRFLDNDKKLRDLMRNKYDIKHVDDRQRRWFGGVAKNLTVLGLLTLSPVVLVAALVSYINSKTLWVLSDKGLDLRRYIKGLEMYIKVAEKDRLKMMQSPEGAEKTGLKDPTDPAQIVKLYEKLLPYAVLLGQEKEWGKRLGEYYASTDSAPSWYVGRSAFNANAFSSSMSNFTSAAVATSASSSSSGGSSGGGFSGGGGGGGGGGFR